MMRINRYLATCGVASRRAAEALVTAGRVTVNGVVITDLATRIDETRDRVELDGKAMQSAPETLYLVLNKPKGYVTTASDDLGRKTVLDLVDLAERVFPVGRLDYNSTGLLLLTNDGELAYRLTHPRYKVPKLYRAILDRDFRPDDFPALTRGVDLEDGATQPCQARHYAPERDHVEIELREGRQQQVRRMFATLGYRVKALNRIRFGPLLLGGLPRGRWRFLDPAEIMALRQAAGLS